MKNQHFGSQNAPAGCLAAAGSLLLVGCCWLAAAGWLLLAGCCWLAAAAGWLAAADWRATKSGAACNSHNDIYDIGTEILYFQCFATTDMFLFSIFDPDPAK